MGQGNQIDSYQRWWGYRYLFFYIDNDRSDADIFSTSLGGGEPPTIHFVVIHNP